MVTDGRIAYDAGAGDVMLAIAEQSEWAQTTFHGESIDGTTIVGKYTYFGDANLDGQVTTDDYVAIDLGLGTGDSWVQGDVDVNGFVSTDDYVVVDLNLGKGTSTPLAWAETQAAMIALHTEMFGATYVERLAYAREHGFASVPEPGSISGLAVASILLARRRRKEKGSSELNSPNPWPGQRFGRLGVEETDPKPTRTDPFLTLF